MKFYVLLKTFLKVFLLGNNNFVYSCKKYNCLLSVSSCLRSTNNLFWEHFELENFQYDYSNWQYTEISYRNK